MTQSVTIVENECCGTCGAIGEVLKIDQRLSATIGIQAFFCVPCHRKLSVRAEKAISEYALAKHFPEARR